MRISLVFPSSRELNVFYGRSLLGKIVKIDVDHAFLESKAPQSYGHQSSSSSLLTLLAHRGCSTVAEIERALYCRDFDKVYGRLLQYSDESVATNKYPLPPTDPLYERSY